VRIKTSPRETFKIPRGTFKITILRGAFEISEKEQRAHYPEKNYTGLASINTATSSAVSLPLFTHAWLVPR